RIVYRLLILFVAEDRDILFDPASEIFARQRYAQYYSTARLRRMAGLRLGTRHADLFRALWLVMEQLGGEAGCQPLGLPALNGFLFSSSRALPDLVGCELENATLLAAVRALAFTEEKAIRRTVDYKNLGAEELGSVYESLLELHPQLDIASASFKLTSVSGNARKTSGSYYTPTSLIDCLLDSALDPVLVEASARPDPEAALLALKVCDPACGSGHFLIAAAHRIAKKIAAVRTGTEEPGLLERRAALRDVIGHCIYGVGINPMAVELCKVSLWMEAIEPGKPLSFLDAHIQCGNSLLGTTPALLREGIPDEAFNSIESDDKKICSYFKKKNKDQHSGQLSLFAPDLQPWERLGDLGSEMRKFEEMRDDTVMQIHQKEAYYEQMRASESYANSLLWANAWCAAFVWKKTDEFAYPITEEIFRNFERSPYSMIGWMRAEVERLAAQYQFFHWHLAFPDVFHVPANIEEAENAQAGWSGGFDVVLGNPPWEKIKLQEKEWFASRRPE
ncbi:MAG: Eco57I restriction-modification methylase domain-containing protein, partial [Ktedonobacteraceae bacterium]